MALKVQKGGEGNHVHTNLPDREARSLLLAQFSRVQHFRSIHVLSFELHGCVLKQNKLFGTLESSFFYAQHFLIL
jgi:hypothetical protein